MLAISTEKGAFSVIAEQLEDAPEFVGDDGGNSLPPLPSGDGRGVRSELSSCRQLPDSQWYPSVMCSSTRESIQVAAYHAEGS